MHPSDADDYLAIRSLVEDLLSAGVGATVSDVMRETVEAVKRIASANPGDDGVTVQKLAAQLNLDRTAVQRRVQAAREKGFLVNTEEKRGRPGRYTLGEPLPEQHELLPLTIPDQGCAPIPPDPAGSMHSVSDSNSEIIEEGVHVCTAHGGMNTEEVEEVIDCVD